MAYEGSCHCGAVTFTVEGDIPDEAISCNCSWCRRRGLLLTFVPASAFTLTAGQDELQTYRFNTHRIEHLFCRTCGLEGFAKASRPDGTDTRAVNLRCVPAADLDALRLIPFDGASK
ncbi:GFA family protein [Prosthecomicrobium sp. N25]|uniref:GFA family protein n=1 Tax=Prosthecomicrobium sp. N25 TaxID=3129254 RepID=UPI0030768C0A